MEEKTDQSGLSPLHYSCLEGDTKLTKSVIENGEDVEAKTQEGWTPLMFAAKEGHIEDALLLIAKNREVVHTFTRSGKTALHYACIYNRASFAKELLDHGANISATDILGGTPIHCATVNKSRQTFETLLEYKADVDVKSSNGTTPLHLACRVNDTYLVGRLLDNGADIEAQTSPSNHYTTGIKVANHLDRYLLEPAFSKVLVRYRQYVHNIKRPQANNITDNDDMKFDGITPLMYAAFAGAAETIELLINRGANIEARNSLGLTALHIACAFGKTQAIKQLITKKANLEERDKNGFTPLHFASLFGHGEAVKVLIENGADIEARTVDGCTPLVLAIEEGQCETVNILIQNNANVYSANKKGYLPLHFACKRGNLEIYNIVMKGFLNFKTKLGCTHAYSANSSELSSDLSTMGLQQATGEVKVYTARRYEIRYFIFVD